ncbi:MAG: response regulator transcription factor [Proteobacteria bacterium]|nr:MAG: response regulator transcription factor [Pseudomonadota bacterium]
MSVLIVEDDSRISGMIAQVLRDAGFITEVADNGVEGFRRALSGIYSLLVVDLMLPEKDGLSLISDLRAAGKQTPVLVLSAKRSVDERVVGLQNGADDYLTKPFAVSELLARCQALLRRTVKISEESKLSYRDLSLDLLSRQVLRSGKQISLQSKEFLLLEFLMRNSERIVSKAEILQAVWKYDFDPQTNVVDVLVCRLRNKLDDGFDEKSIRTIRGLGYSLNEVR